MGVGVELDCLEGIRVVDFTQFEAGPSCTESLAWLGAEVVKIENLRTGDPGRRLQGGKPDPWYFHQFNANKKSVTLNLKSPRGLEIVRALLKKADVTIENMAPGTIERLGLGYDEVKKINPGIIYCQVKGFGAGSPYEKSLAFDMIAQAAGGTISVTGEGDRAPVKPGPSLGDTGTGMLMAISILGALYKRARTGQGRLLQVAMQDAMLHYMRVPFSRTQLSGKAVIRDGTSRSTPGGLTPSALYPCSPGGPNDYVYVFCSRANPEHWQRLLKVIGREDLSGDERYDTQQARSQRGAEVDAIIAAWTRQHSKEEAMKLFGAAGVPAGAVFDSLELMNDPTFEARSIMQTIDHPTTGKVKMPAWPVRFDGAPPKVKPSPQLGQHVEDVLGSWLGMDAGEITALRQEGVV
jgi:formyl-CoA transferase